MSELYDRYLELDYASYRSVVYFFEKNRSEINNLDFDEYFNILIHYNKSLFEIGAYTKFLNVVDKAIELVIDLNIFSFNGRDVFSELLFLKAAAYFNLGQYKNSEKILNELLGINPNDRDAKFLLKKCIARQTYIHQKTRAISVFMFVLTAFIISIDILVIRAYRPELHSYFAIVECGVFGLGLILLAGGDLFDRLKIEQSVFSVIRKKKGNKKSKRERDIFSSF